MPKSLMIVGMPRSGTSLVSSIFANQGYYVAEDGGDDLRPGDADNPGGYWEAESLIRRNVEVFEAAGFPHDNTWLYEPISAEAVARISELEPISDHEEFARQYVRHAPWMWKDPRLCYTLPYWWKLVDRNETRVLLTVRDPMSIYHSFVRLKWREAGDEALEDVLARVEDHLGAARRAIEALDIPTVEVVYEDFGEHGERIAAELSSFMDLDLGVADLMYDGKHDHSTARGRLQTALFLRWSALPDGVRGVVKAVVPRRVREALRPGGG